MNKWVILGLLAVGIGVAVAAGGGGIDTEGGDGAEVEILAGAKMTSGTATAKFRVLRETDGDFVWVQYRLPGKGWVDLKDKGEVAYFDLGSGTLGIAGKGIQKGMGLLKLLGYRDIEGDILFGADAGAL